MWSPRTDDWGPCVLGLIPWCIYLTFMANRLLVFPLLHHASSHIIDIYNSHCGQILGDRSHGHTRQIFLQTWEQPWVYRSIWSLRKSQNTRAITPPPVNNKNITYSFKKEMPLWLLLGYHNNTASWSLGFYQWQAGGGQGCFHSCFEGGLIEAGLSHSYWKSCYNAVCMTHPGLAASYYSKAARPWKPVGAVIRVSD